MMVLAIVFGTPVVVFLGVFVYMHLTGEGKLRRQLRGAPVCKIGELLDGRNGRVVGTAQRHGGAVLTAPISGRECLYFVVRLEQRTYDGKNHIWQQVAREEKGVPFVVIDDSGRALIDPTGARVSLEVDDFSRSGEVSTDVPEPREAEFLARHLIARNRPLRYHEAVITDGERIAVFGAGVREPDPDAQPTAAYRGDAPTRLHMTSSSKSPLLISDYASTTAER